MPTIPTPIFPGVIGQSQAIRGVYETIRQVAPSSATVLLTGETGTGKELVAKAIHELSPRSSGPFIRVNCGALSESLLESELFGHVKGAFTSALENRTGRFEAAHGGTIFLDEINSVSYKLQVKLLRVLQEQEFERVGDTKTIKIDCRVVAATNRDLHDEISAGRFREDLFYRLNVLPIDLPPLRERREDIPLLIDFFRHRYAASNHRPVPDVSSDVVEMLQAYHWPGNVRELQNYIERAVVLCTGERLTQNLFASHVTKQSSPFVRPHAKTLQSLSQELVSRGILEFGDREQNLYDRIVSLVERELIDQVLKSCGGVQTKAAIRMGINRNTLHKKISDYALESREES